MAARWRYTTPKELRDLMKSPKVLGRDYAVVDVRDDDFAGGNIKGCLRAPYRDYENKISKIYPKIKDVPTVIFHCTLSQVRGPKSARIYAELRDSSEDLSQSKAQEILVLQGGFAAFQEEYKDDPDLVEKWEKSVWESPF